MKILRIKIDNEAEPNDKGYHKAFENQNKNGNRNAPDFKGQGIAVWITEGESVYTTNKAVEAGAFMPKVAKTIQG